MVGRWEDFKRVRHGKTAVSVDWEDFAGDEMVEVVRAYVWDEVWDEHEGEDEELVDEEDEEEDDEEGRPNDKTDYR